MQGEDLAVAVAARKEKSGEVTVFEISGNIEMVSFQVEADAEISGTKMLVNGFQTWTESIFTDGSIRLRNLRMLFAKIMRPYGDYFFYKYVKGDLHSHTYTCFTGANGTSLLMGSIDETSGYTIFQGYIDRDRLVIHKDCEGLAVNGRCQILKIYAAEGPENLVFDEYFAFFGGMGRTPSPSTGWTSWYNYYTHITEKTILDNLEAVKRENIPLDIFQIDDGYQTAVGDWLSINAKFPNGMKRLADEIKKSGYQPGLWLAPFVCEKNSQLYREHPDWILRGKSGRPVMAGWNPNWSGYYYPLDIFNEGVKRYLEMVFDTILEDWGFSMVKLDFLYAVALLPRNGRTRAGVMIEAMDFLQYIIGDKLILGCGVPLAPAYKRVDYCRIGADVAPYWEDRRLKYLRSRERVSTLGSLHNTLARNNLNGKVFLNDPDVFMLRDKNTHLNGNQKYTLFFLNNLLGGLSFISDYIADYSHAAMETFKSIFPKPSAEILKTGTLRQDVYEIEFKAENRYYLTYANLGGRRENIFLHLGTYFNEIDFIVEGPAMVTLEPYETKCFLRVDAESGVCVLGSKGYIFPAAHLEKIRACDGEILIDFKKGFINKTEVYVKSFGQEDTLVINGTACKVEQRGNFRFARFVADPAALLDSRGN